MAQSKWQWHRNLIESARELRKTMTPAEQALWTALRDRRFKQYKFRRQVPMERFVVDFLCIPLHTIIELDGKIHDKQKGHDAERELYLQQMGFTIIRFRNEDVIENLDNVLNRIEESLWKKTGHKHSPFSQTPEQNE